MPRPSIFVLPGYGYAYWIDISGCLYEFSVVRSKQQVQAAQVKSAVAVNSSLIQLYWNMGKMIVDNQALFKAGTIIWNNWPETWGLSFRK